MLACSLSEARRLSYSLADELYAATLCFSILFLDVLKQVSSCLGERCSSPEMFCRLQSITPSARRCGDDGLNSHFQANSSFKWSWVIWKPWNHLWEQCIWVGGVYGLYCSQPAGGDGDVVPLLSWSYQLYIQSTLNRQTLSISKTASFTFW